MTNVKRWAASKVVARGGNDEGQGLAEYGLILALIAVVCIAGLTILGGNINSFLNSVSFGAA
ncbi:MAG: Flp family type IVb pilin [Tepidiformaceae bacterium]